VQIAPDSINTVGRKRFPPSAQFSRRESGSAAGDSRAEMTYSTAAARRQVVAAAGNFYCSSAGGRGPGVLPSSCACSLHPFDMHSIAAVAELFFLFFFANPYGTSRSSLWNIRQNVINLTRILMGHPGAPYGTSGKRCCSKRESFMEHFGLMEHPANVCCSKRESFMEHSGKRLLL
jgi:hypothetical protein